ncbi:MAG: CheR family methyltransferase [Elusimicrobiota bacterium]
MKEEQEYSNFFFDKLKRKVYEDRGFDFSQYNERHVKRRINTRLMALRITEGDYRAYLKLIEKDGEEYNRLFDAFSVNVTEFFRDNNVWETLEKDIIPGMIEKKRETGSKCFRVWSAGCSTGEEPYSMAILLSEILKKTKTDLSVTIISTDIDKDAIEKAREGVYIKQMLKNVSPGRLEKNFGKEDPDKYRISAAIKEMVIFKDHNFIRDRHLSNMDMVLCRNVVIYFTHESKDIVFENFYNALFDKGYLILGKSEILIAGKGKMLFTPVNTKEHIFIKNDNINIYFYIQVDKEVYMYRVLIVDDSKFMRMTLKKMLEQDEKMMVVGEAENEGEALEKYQELHPDLVTMDIIMPVENGLAAVEKIIKIDPQAKILMISAMGQYATMEEAMKLGAKGFIVKPVKPEVLRKKAQQIISM